MASGGASSAAGGAVSPREAGALAPLVRDAAFKRVFGDNDSDFARVALRELINAMEVLDGATVEAVVSIEPSEQPEYLEGRTIIYDVVCDVNMGGGKKERVVIELQKAPMRTMIADRMVGYVARQYNKQWSKGGKSAAGPGTYALRPVHALALLDFVVDKNIDDAGDMIQHYAALPRPAGKRLSKALSMRICKLNNYTFVQLPLAPTQEALATAGPAELWAHLIHYSGTYTMETLPPVFKHDDVLKGVAELVRYAAMKPEEIADMNAEEDYLKQLASTTAAAELERDAATKRADEAEQRADEAEQRAAEDAAARAAAQQQAAAAQQRATEEAAARAAAQQQAAAAQQQAAAAQQRATEEAAARAAAQQQAAAAQQARVALEEQLAAALKRAEDAEARAKRARVGEKDAE
jgi:hypothetical protein